jgi:hypothetical protein
VQRPLEGPLLELFYRRVVDAAMDGAGERVPTLLWFALDRAAGNSAYWAALWNKRTISASCSSILSGTPIFPRATPKRTRVFFNGCLPRRGARSATYLDRWFRRLRCRSLTAAVFHEL